MIFEAEITIYNGKWLENAKAESICLPLLLHGPRDRFFFLFCSIFYLVTIWYYEKPAMLTRCSHDGWEINSENELIHV